jgi:hypothetical protein
LSTINPTLPDVGSNTGPRNGKPEANRPSYSMALEGSGQGLISDIVLEFTSRTEENHKLQLSEQLLIPYFERGSSCIRSRRATNLTGTFSKKIWSLNVGITAH